MRTKQELEKARLPIIQMVKAKWTQVSSNNANYIQEGDLIPQQTPGETYEQQILEVLLDIRDKI